MGPKEIEWVVSKIVKAITDGRPHQAYGLTVALAHYVK
jgi:predicted transcriptional regulator